jgi:hypothetical protein
LKLTSSTRNGRRNTIAGRSQEICGLPSIGRAARRPRAHLVGVVRIYYLIRGGEISRFAARGPRAKAAIEAVWSTPDDRQIDNFVRHALQYGILHKTDFPEHTYPEFARMFADVQELGAGCTTADN